MAVDWKLWEDRLAVELWEAVALSLDLDPERPSGEDLYLRKSLTFRGPTNALTDEFHRRFEVARDHRIAGNLPSVAHGANDWTARVALTSFRTWAESLRTPWLLPEGFPQPATQNSKPGRLAEPSTETSAVAESVSDRNLRWASREAIALAKDSSRGVKSKVAREISETEAMKLETVEKGIRAGRAPLAELARQGKMTNNLAAPASVFPLPQHSRKETR